jgi:hypothetical protein
MSQREVEPNAVIESLLRQLMESAHKIALLEAFINNAENNKTSD